MIHNEKEYREAVARIGREKIQLAQQMVELKGLGLSPDEIKRAVDPLRSFHQQLEEEVLAYQRLKQGQFDEIDDLRNLGQLLVSLRIAKGLTQRELAQRLGVHETQVSRDERNEYHGITLERASKVLDALGARMHGRVELPKSNVA